MAEFKELIKNFDRIRDYMRQFYVYGFKVRGDYDKKSARTYDNERRRIESWLSAYTKSTYTVKGKTVYISVDSKTIPENPLYAAWKAKSFTDNDIMLHFFIPDQLMDVREGLTAGELGDRMAAQYGALFDSQTVRLKLKEYETLGILKAKKDGKAVRYRMEAAPNGQAADAAGAAEFPSLLEAVKFYQGAAPFGVIGSTLLDREEMQNDCFQFKHHFIVHTLEDGVLLDILSAMKEGRAIAFLNKSTRSGLENRLEGIPLKIFVSTRTGRRYVCCYLEGRNRFVNYRLDCIAEVTAGAVCQSYARKKELLERNLDRCWGVSFGGRSRLEEICIKFYIDEEKEPYILERLYREGHGGEILKVRAHEYLYTGAFFDTNEMLSWVKTFTGRVMDIQGSSGPAIAKITDDWEKMYQMYCGGENGTV